MVVESSLALELEVLVRLSYTRINMEKTPPFSPAWIYNYAMNDAAVD